ncbi:MAG: hypothetical protein E2590_07370 [Chryseobacterium sp.]|nr:hypothetical protein [Chryseobacterium sp.]
MGGVSYGNYLFIKREIFPTSISFECSKIVEYNIGVGETREKLRFKVGGKNDDNKRDIKFELNNSNISLSTIQWKAENEWILLTNITGKKIGDTLITVKVEGKTLNIIKIKCVNYKDVFSNTEAKRLIDEINYIKPKADAETAPEYDENYCMQAAERGISELLKNYTDFYSVERGTDKHRNKIGFSGLTAIDRGNKIKANGFVSSQFEFNDYSIDHTKRKSIIDSASYGIVKYDIISFSTTGKNKLYGYFDNIIRNKIGFHAFYFTVTNGFHTLLLLIDNSNPCDAKYAIYDQHGITSSSGKFNDIAEGIRKQTSWTFANTCLNRFSAGKSSQWDSTKTILWKIQRK